MAVNNLSSKNTDSENEKDCRYIIMINQSIIDKVQAVEIEIMEQIDQICRKHDLSYFAIGGSALGAVRHEGFIPWDDDIDIGMPRKDYEAFLKIAGEELSPDYHIQNFYTEPKTPFYFTKIRKNNTKFVEYYLKDYDIHQGIFVDIFPFDNVPEKEWVRNVHFRVCRTIYQIFLAKSLTTVCSSRFEQKENYKSYLRKFAHILLTPIPKAWLFHLLDKSVQLFNDKPCQEISHIVRRRLRVYLKDLYPILYLKFHNFKMPVPNNYDAYLKAQFGNYDTLPPEDKRYGHLPYQVEFDTVGGKK